MALENIRDILVARVNNLDNGTHDVMTEAKLIISDRVKVEVRVLSFQYGVLKVSTEDSSAASEIRLQSSDLVELINSKITPSIIKKLTVSVR